MTEIILFILVTIAVLLAIYAYIITKQYWALTQRLAKDIIMIEKNKIRRERRHREPLPPPTTTTPPPPTPTQPFDYPRSEANPSCHSDSRCDSGGD